MIVTCRNCETEFEFDELGLAAEGAPVRCSACQAVFVLAPEFGAEDVLSDLAQSDPDPETEEEGEPHSDHLGAGDAPDVFGSMEEFAVDTSPPEALRDSLEKSSPFDLDDSDEILDATPLPEDDFSDLGGLMDEAEEAFKQDQNWLDDGSRTSLDQEAESPVSGGSPEVPEGFGPEHGTVDSPEPKVAIGSIALASIPAGQHRDNPPVEHRLPGFRKRFRAVGRGLGWGLTLALVVLALMSVVRDTTDSIGTTQQSIEVGSLLADGLKGEWVDTMAGQTLLTVTGQLSNPTGSAEVLGAVLEVSLVGPDGRRLAWPSAPMGVRVSESELRELPLAALKAAQGRAARTLALTMLRPGESVAVQAIFPGPPDHAVRFDLDLGAPVEGSLDGPLEDEGTLNR